MEDHGSNGCKIVDDAKHNLHGNLDVLVKAQNVSDCYGKFVDANSEVEKKGHKQNHEVSHCEDKTLQEMERCETYNRASSHGFSGGYENCLNAQSSVVSSSTSLLVSVGMRKEESCVEKTSWEAPVRNEVASLTGQTNLSGDGDPTEGFKSNHSPEGMESRHHISAKSDVSSDTGGQPLNKELHETSRMKGFWLNASEDGLKTVMQATIIDKQLKTESCSSNSVHAIFPASSSDSCQEASVDGKSCKLSNSSMNSYSCPALQSSVVLGTASQTATNTSESVGNFRSNDGEMVLQMIADKNSRTLDNIVLPIFCIPMKKTAEHMDQDKPKVFSELDNAVKVVCGVVQEKEEQDHSCSEAFRSSFFVQEKNYKTPHLSVHSTNPNKEDCFAATGSEIKLDNKQGKFDKAPQMSMKNDNSCLEVREASKDIDMRLMLRANEELHEQEPSHLLAKSKDVSPIDQSPHVGGIDLNEDIFDSGGEFPEQLVSNSVSSPAPLPIAVMAKRGVLLSLPTTPVRFGGELGWKGSAATSAFRPTLSKSSNIPVESSTGNSNCCSERSRGYKGIDLNVAAAGDDIALELFHRKTFLVPSSSLPDKSSVGRSSKQAERLPLDLNRLSENDDHFPQSYWPTSSLKRHVGDFDLNDSPSIRDVHYDDCEPGQRAQRFKKNRRLDDGPVTSVRYKRQLDLKGLRPPYWADLSTMQSFVHSRAQPILAAVTGGFPPIAQSQRVVPIQAKQAYTPSQPHAFTYDNRFCIDPGEPLSSTSYTPGVLPYINDPCGRAFLHQMAGSGTLPTFAGAPHFIDVAGRPSPSDIAAIRPRFDGGINSSESGGNGEGNTTLQLLIPFK